MEFLAAGTVMFFIVYMLLLIAIGACILFDNIFLAIVATIVTVGALEWGSRVEIFGWIKNHPIGTIWVAILYVGLGVAWAFVKWITLVRDSKKKYAETEAYHKSNYIQRMQKGGYGIDYTYEQYLYEHDIIPTARSHKSDITEWLAWWPFSIVITFLGDYIARFFRWVYTYLITSFDRISKWMWSDINMNVVIPAVSPKTENKSGAGY